MKAAPDANFKLQYQVHLKHLALKGLRPKTIEAYSRAIRRIGAYFDHRIDDLSAAQLADYFHDLLATRSWSCAKLDLYGLKLSHPCAGQAVDGARSDQARSEPSRPP